MPEQETEVSTTPQVLKLDSTSVIEEPPCEPSPVQDVKKTKSKRLSVAKKGEEEATSAGKKRNNSAAVSKEKLGNAAHVKREATKLGRVVH